jgi:hypothetical protein
MLTECSNCSEDKKKEIHEDCGFRELNRLTLNWLLSDWYHNINGGLYIQLQCQHVEPLAGSGSDSELNRLTLNWLLSDWYHNINGGLYIQLQRQLRDRPSQTARDSKHSAGLPITGSTTTLRSSSTSPQPGQSPPISYILCLTHIRLAPDPKRSDQGDRAWGEQWC